MNVTFVLGSAGHTGGVKVIAEIASKLRERGHGVHIVSQPFPRPDWRKVVKALWHLDPSRAQSRTPGPHLDRLAEVHRVLERNRPVVDADLPDADVVVATWWETAPWVAALSPTKGAKVYFMQDYGAPGQEIDRVAPTWDLPFAFITISGWLRDAILARNPDADVTVMLNAVDHRRFHSAPRERPTTPRVGFIYKGAPSKGLDTAYEAVRIVRETTPLEAVTFGPRKRPAALPDFVDYREAPTDDEVREIYRSCTAWLMPSRLEGFGLPLIEGLACGTPLVSTRAGAGPDLVRDGENGYLVDVGDAPAMAEGIRRIVGADDETWKAMSRAAQATVGDYDWDDAVDVFEGALERAAAAR